MLIKQESITSQKLGSRHIWRIANSVLKKGKSAISPLFNGLEVLSSASDKAKLFAENFSKNSNLDDSGTSLPVFPSLTNLKLHNISVTPKMVKGCVRYIFARLFLSLNESPCQIRKNVFYFTSKVLSFSRKSNFRIFDFQIL